MYEIAIEQLQRRRDAVKEEFKAELRNIDNEIESLMSKSAGDQKPGRNRRVRITPDEFDGMPPGRALATYVRRLGGRVEIKRAVLDVCLGGVESFCGRDGVKHLKQTVSNNRAVLGFDTSGRYGNSEKERKREAREAKFVVLLDRDAPAKHVKGSS